MFVCSTENVSLTDEVKETFTSSGVNLAGEKGFKPHITAMKLSRAPILRKKGVCLIPLGWLSTPVAQTRNTPNRAWTHCLLCAAGIKKICSTHYAEFAEKQFGTQVVERLQLCAMMGPKDENGYYRVLHSVPIGKHAPPSKPCIAEPVTFSLMSS